VFATGLAVDQADRFPDMRAWSGAVLALLDRPGREEPGGRSSSSTATRTGPVTATVCPYKGLYAFQPDEAALFFGRSNLVEELTSRLVGSRVLAVGGPSGSGKSSVVRAGLIPALARGAVAGSENWPIALMTPGPDPLGELGHQLDKQVVRVVDAGDRVDLHGDPTAARGLAERTTDATGGMVVCVDQFEELFTLVADPAERNAFVEALAAMCDPTDSRVRLVIAVRADFYGNCAMHEWLARRMTDNQVLVGPMTRVELRQAIELPARAAGLRLEDGLVDRIIDDGGHEPGGLPLVAHALVETWRRRRGNTLTIAGYTDAGGVTGAISQSAEATYGGLDDADAAAMRRLFLRLVNPGAGTADTRRRVDWTTATGDADPDAVRNIISTLTELRLLTVDEQHVEISHEALIQTWPRLRTWIDENRDALRTRQRLQRSAAEWCANDRDDDLLLRGTPLAQALEWSAAHPDLRSPDVEEFVVAGERRRAAEEHERENARRRSRRVRTAAVTVLATFAVVALVASLFAYVAARRAERNQDEAERRFAQALAAIAEEQVEASPRLALALAAESIARSGQPTAESLGTMVSARVAESSTPLVPSTAALGTGDALRVTVAPDGGLVATGNRDGTIRLWDPETGSQLAELTGGHDKSAEAIDFTPDGRTLLSAGSDGRLVRWDVSDPAAPGPPVVLQETAGVLWEMGVDPTGEQVALASEAGSVLLVDIRPPVRDARELADIGEDVTTVEFSPDGELVAAGTGSGRVGMWDAETGTEVMTPFHPHRSDVWEIEFGADGETFATASSDGRVRLFDTGTGELLQAVVPSAIDARGVQLHPNGSLAVAGDEDGGVRFWDLDAEGEIAHLSSPHSDQVLASDMSADGSRLATLSRDQTMRIWEEGSPGGTELGGQAGTSVDDVDAAFAAAAAPDGELVVVGRDSGRVDIVDVATGETVAEITDAHETAVWSAAFARDGELVVTGDANGGMAIFSVPDGELVAAIPAAHSGRVWDLAVSEDGATLLSAGEDGFVRFWDPADGTVLGEVEAPSEPFALALAPEGDEVVTTGEGSVTRISVSQRQVVDSVMIEDNRLWDAAFSPDGELLAIASDDEVVTVLDAEDLTTVAALTPQPGGATSVAFVGDTSLLATLSRDGVVQMWDPRTETRIGPQLPVHEADSWRVVGVPDGSRSLVTTSADGRAVIWDLLSEERACELVGEIVDEPARRRYLGPGEEVLACDPSGS
jgi:WD40 repeat protein